LDNLGIYALGFLGQALFGARLIVQLFLSEKQKKVVSPVIFWQLSLAASFLFLIYGIIREDIVIIVGQTLSYFIYIRNLQLKEAWSSIPFWMKALIICLPFFAIGFAFSAVPAGGWQGHSQDLLHPIMILGAIGQLALNLRFVYQWYYSERSRASILPLGFWHISTWASVLVIIYAVFHPIHGWDPVLLVSQSLGIVVYARNIIIYQRSRNHKTREAVQNCT
jgi:lipid-A-disaccharide synthase-like uncharacterized protein